MVSGERRGEHSSLTNQEGGGVVGTLVGLVGDQVNLFATQPKSSDPLRISNERPLV